MVMKQKVLAIAHPQFKAGFLLAGVDFWEVDDPEKVRKMIRKALESGEYGVILVEDDFEPYLDYRTKNLVYQSVNPIFFFVNLNPEHKVSVEEQIREIVRRAIGFELNVKT